MHLEGLQRALFRYFLRQSSLTKVSADKMMVTAKGPVWHQKPKKQGIIPKGLRGLDREATWGTSRADGWIYGHGTFSLTPHRLPMVGICQWMANAGNEAKRMAQEIITYEGIVKKSFMDSKADDQHLYFRLTKDHRIQLVTVPRKGMDNSASRKKMIKQMLTKKNKQDDKARSITVAPMQGLVADIFELERCWMRGDANNRWLFAAMGIAVQMAQWWAWTHKRSTWNVKSDVVGL
jgi:hypothetical protein